MKFLIVIAIFVMFFNVRKFYNNYKIQRYGKIGEKKVYKKLKRFKKRGYVIFNNILLPLYDKSTQIDHVVVSPYGVIVIETKNYKGTVYADADSKVWKHFNKGWKDFYNPIKQNQTHVNTITHLLRKEGFDDIPIYNVVIFVSNNCKIENVSYLPLFKLSDIRKIMKYHEKLAEKTIDTAAVVNVIKKYELIDKVSKRKHLEYVKQKAI